MEFLSNVDFLKQPDLAVLYSPTLLDLAGNLPDEPTRAAFGTLMPSQTLREATSTIGTDWVDDDPDDLPSSVMPFVHSHHISCTE